VVSEALLVRVLAVEGVLFVGTLALFCGHGLWSWWYGRRTRPLLSRARAIVTTTLEEPFLQSAELRWLRALRPRLQIQVFFDVAPNFSGTQYQRLTVLARELGLPARADVYCRSRWWWRRLQGARLFSLFGGGEEVVPLLFHDRNAVVRAQAAEWAAAHPSPVVIATLLSLLDDPDGLCRFTAQDSLLRIGGPVIEPLVRYLSDPSGPQVEAALRVAVGLADPRLLSPALRLCRHKSPQVRVLAAALLGMLGGGGGWRCWWNSSATLRRKSGRLRPGPWANSHTGPPLLPLPHSCGTAPGMSAEKPDLPSALWGLPAPCSCAGHLPTRTPSP
jgi:hypothetical protein